MKEGFKNWLLISSIILVTGIVTYFALPSRELDKAEEILGVSDGNYKYAPFITSVSPTFISVGEDFRYEIEASDLDSSYEQLSYYLVEKPIWIYIQGNVVVGKPTEAGTYKFVVSVSDGTNSSSQVNYILVEENE
ncbi:MAG: hypothetical protein PHG60_01145 [Candidatus Dojkabacteria bacterium]|jgi:hypothetical protein|nr:hypothetical protein [Candidatus Dojkabacteria bacterium]MDD2270175.1 hypothetical protein [Candidatus Dojkabacteria bacterium]